MSFVNQYRDLSRDRPWTARILIILLTVLVLLLLIRLSLSLAIKAGTNYWLSNQNIESKIDDIELSIFNGNFILKNFSGSGKNNKIFSIEKLRISWQWQPVLKRHIVVDGIEIHSLNIDTQFFDNGNMNIAGLLIEKDNETESKEQKHKPETDSPPWDITVNKIILSAIEICAQQFSSSEEAALDYCAKLSGFEWQGDLSFRPSTSPGPGDIPLYIKGNLSFQDLILNNKLLNLNLLQLGLTELKDINITTTNDIDIKQIKFNEFSMLQRSNSASVDDAHMYSFNKLSISPIKLTQFNRLELGNIELIGSRAYFNINKDGHTDLKMWLPEKPDNNNQDKQNDKKANKTNSAERFHFSINEFVFNTDNKLIFTDNSLKEPYSINLHDVNFIYTSLDSQTPEKPGHTLLSLIIDEHGKLNMEADINPLSKRPSLKGKTNLSGIDLRMFAPLTKQHIGQNIRSGQLDAILDLNIDKGKIASNINITLHQFELKTLSKKEAEELNSEFGFPLSSALSLLRDRDNAIRLEIPVNGDVDNPEFDPRDAIVKASSKAITAAVLHYYTPFGLIFATESLFDLATALHFEPILFEPGNTELASSQHEQLSKLASLMKDRPGIHLTLCGITNQIEVDALFPSMANSNATEQKDKTETKVITKESLSILKNLAEKRSATIKNYLIKNKNINASRLIECAPEFIKDGITGVEISI